MFSKIILCLSFLLVGNKVFANENIFTTMGSLSSPQKTQLGARVSGSVQEVYVDVGDIIKKGQKLLTLDPFFYQIGLEQEKINLLSAETNLSLLNQNINTAQADIERDLTDLEYNRMKNLWEKPEGVSSSVPKNLFDTALFKKRKAQSALKASESRLAEMKIRIELAKNAIKLTELSIRNKQEILDEATIFAPYDAIITRRMVDPGEPVTSIPITHLLEIQQMDQLELIFSLPQQMLSKVGVGTNVDYEIEGIKNGKGSGKISLVLPEMDESTRTFKSRVMIENKNLKLKPGLMVKVNIKILEQGTAK